MPLSSGRTSTARGPVKRGCDQAIGRSRGGLTTKIHVIVDALRNPLALSLTGGNAHDITQAESLAAQVEPDALLADKGYDADSFINSLEVRAIKLSFRQNQPARSNEPATSQVVSRIFRTFIMRRLRFQIAAVDRVAAYSCSIWRTRLFPRCIVVVRPPG